MEIRTLWPACLSLALAAFGTLLLTACGPVAAGDAQTSGTTAGVSASLTGSGQQPDKTLSTAAPLQPGADSGERATDVEVIPQPDSPVAAPVGEETPAQGPPRAVTGVGLWPRTYDVAGMRDALARTAGVSDVGMLQVTLAWDDLRGDTAHLGYHDQYDYLVVPGWDDNRNLFDHYGLGKAVWLDFLVSSDRRYLNLPAYGGARAFTNPQVAAAYVADCVWLADYFDPDYLALGTEIDEYLRQVDAAERTAVLNAYVTARVQIKARHPDLVVFVYYQYENVGARDLWDLIRPFVQNSDLAAFSTYPSLPPPGPALSTIELPSDYYAPISKQYPGGPPAAFVELGHPAAACALFPSGSPAEQEAFLARVARIAPRDTALLVWSHLYDPDYSGTCAPDTAQYFGAMGLLRRSDSVPTPTWTTWSELVPDQP